jgi:hypothetical protein
MTDLVSIGPPLGLQSTSVEMSPEQRCSIRVRNIELLCDLDWRARLLLGAELTAMKWTGEFMTDTVWTSADTQRDWVEWLKRRDFRLEGGDRPINDQTANTIIMLSVLYAGFVAENESRAERGLLPLPLPTNVSQLRPYQSMMQRVDDWERPASLSSLSRMEPPFAEAQPEVIAAWQEAWEAIPPDKRDRKGEARPPTEAESQKYLRQKEGLKQLKQREEREIEEAKQKALTVGQKPADPERQAKAAAPPKATKKPAPPKKSAEELEEERRQFQLQQDVQSYRLKLNNLQQSAESLDAFLRNTLAREGSEAYLQAMRQVDRGIFSVSDDIKKLRDAVVVCQSIYKLITEPYVAPQPISRREVDPSTASVDVEAVA